MRQIVLVAVVAAQIGFAAISDQEVRRRVSAIEGLAASEPRSMAVATLVHTATVVKPYLPVEARRLLRNAFERGRPHPDLRLSYADVRRWMELDPVRGEADLRRLPNQHHLLTALSSYYQFKKLPERGASAAADAIRASASDPFADSSPWAMLAEVRPAEAVEQNKLPLGQGSRPADGQRERTVSRIVPGSRAEAR